MDYTAMTRDELIKEISSLKGRALDTEAQAYVGRCFRHHLRFIPSEEFHNNCPACYWEHEAGEERALREKISPKR